MSEEERQRLRKLGRASSLGYELAVAVIGGLLLGYYLDGRFGTSPKLALVGVGIGSVVGFYSLWKFARDAAREDRQGDERR